MVDITEKNKTEDALKESEEKLKNILSSSPDAITVTDLKGNITECNEATVMLHSTKHRQGICFRYPESRRLCPCSVPPVVTLVSRAAGGRVSNLPPSKRLGTAERTRGGET